MNPAAPRLSVVLITRNEADRLDACFASLPSGCEIIVLDSGSTDGTREAARARGARVEERPFTDYAGQKNAALALATRPWVLSLDADEILSPALSRAIARVTGSEDTPETAFRVRRRLHFLGRPMRFGRTVDLPLRLFRRGMGAFERSFHERLVVTGGPVGRLDGEILHRSYDDLSDYLGRFNVYTGKSAGWYLEKGRRPLPPLIHALRPWGEFVSRYVLHLGFLDGYPGYAHALLCALHSWVKYAKLRELAEAGKDPS